MSPRSAAAPRPRATTAALLACSFSLILLAHAPALALERTVSVAVAHGGTSLSYDGTEYLESGECAVEAVAFTGPPPAPGAPLKALGSSGGAAGGAQWAQTQYSWGYVRCSYRAVRDGVDVSVAVANSAPVPVARVAFHVASFAPSEHRPERLFPDKRNLLGPEIIAISYPAARILVAAGDIASLLDLEPNPSPGRIEITGASRLRVLAPGMWNPLTHSYEPQWMDAGGPISPGASAAWNIEIRVQPLQDSPAAALNGIIRRFVARFPPELKWPDRRPIQMVMLASHVRGQAPDPRNPRCWRVGAAPLDVTTEAGRRGFADALISFADDQVASAKAMNAQGVIVWDIEGEQYEQPTTYVGDPRILAPEMGPVADRFFARFTGAGLRCGMTLRASNFISSLDGQAHQEPIRDSEAKYRNLEEKVAYAARRWGCTLYYVDSDGDTNWPYDEQIFRRLAEKYPKVLFIPENKAIAHYAVAAPYCDMRLHDCLPNKSRWFYPDSFSVINVAGVPLTARDPALDELVGAVAGGDVLLYLGRATIARNRAVAEVYSRARRLKAR